ncbi:unnamed protein product, partial [marine sediment metagenome]
LGTVRHRVRHKMAYENEATERGRLRRQLIDAENHPCAIPNCQTPYDRREVHRIKNGCEGGHYTTENTIVLCYTHHKAQHPHSKFKLGDKVRLKFGKDTKHDAPQWIIELGINPMRPRTIVAVRYDAEARCNFYRLGSNAKGEAFTRNGNPLDGFTDYEFRSFQMIPYEPRRYGKRQYKMAADDSRLTHKIRPLENADNVKPHGTPASQPSRQSLENKAKRQRKCFTCDKTPANNEYRGKHYCAKCYRRIKWQMLPHTEPNKPNYS